MARAVQQAALLDDIGNKGRERLSRKAFTRGFVGNGTGFGIDANNIAILDSIYPLRGIQE